MKPAKQIEKEDAVSCKSVFAISLGVYEDEMTKVRNKKQYQKLLRLEQKFVEVKEGFQIIAHQQLERITASKQLVNFSDELRRNIYSKKFL